MQRLPLSYLKPGMKTYEEVYDAQGRVLCGKGVELTEEMIKRFYELGVSYVTVEGTPVKLPWEKSLEEELSELEKRFEGVNDENLLQIKEILKELLYEKYKARIHQS
ncbi:MAG: hypothetical protein C0197_01720 [Caldimicrobium thiodismutans]|jgi:hypothetical protein|uniref:Uncharacterized protein n=1 Tax=Caldimicrobium thiodismutans TaxID=1653476 RepID=A0A2N7PKR9_9BACT|nr:MAG: hypothetical protein C0197_01720 [Caldimicrobium thiodismutans]